MKKSVVITGASTGIGYDASRLLIENGYQVFGSVRKAADGERVRQTLGDAFTPLLFDVTDYAAIDAAVETVANAVGENGLAGLVNNAGIAVAGPLMNLDIEEFKWQFEVNLFGLMATTQKFLPLLGAQPDAPNEPGRIVNLSSLSGQVSFPFFGAYAASKYGVEAISDALRRELMIYGIDVIVIGPASVKTPIWDKRGGITDDKFIDSDYAQNMGMLTKITQQGNDDGMPVERVSQTILTALTHPSPKARYGLYNGFIQRISRYLPARFLDKQIAQQLNLKRR
jgi:NAD(P)-dependent dehydrogenase (short-subunit alcohol dehydrogenase family)